MHAQELREIATIQHVHTSIDERDMKEGMNAESVQELEVTNEGGMEWDGELT